MLPNHFVQVSMQHLQRNPEQWFKPNEFIPERFDPDHEYYKTPSGEKRHPMSFNAFLTGKRACIGRTFAEAMVRTIIAMVAWRYDIEFVNKSFY
jgi:cytochrome P450